MASVTMYPFLTQSELILDNDQKIIPGAKIEVFDPVSNNHVNIYTYDSANDQYVIAQNPVYLDNLSRSQNSYFSDRLVLCMLYKYRGDFADPLTDDDTENWEYVRNWLGSFSSKSLEDAELVTSISGLKSVDTDRGAVTVVGYWTGDDCEARTYVWNPTSVATPDNGYIVKSDNSDIGRWILQFDGEYLPSTYYGVYPGKEANMNALLTFQTAIGNKLTAPGVYFKKGTYNASTTALTTSKKVLVDADTMFTRTSFTVADVKVIGHASHGVCDWIINDNEGYTSSQTVHSSWFRTLKGFLKSKASHLIYDQYNNFSNAVIDENITLYRQILEGLTELTASYSNSSRISINECEIIGKNLFRVNTDNISFYNMEIKDFWFVTPENRNYSGIGTNIICRSSSNIVNIDNFADTLDGNEFYRAVMVHKGATTLDMHNRTMASFTNSTFTTLKNIVMETNSTLTLTISTYLKHVVGGYVSVSNSNTALDIREYSTIHILNPDNVSYIYAEDSKIGASSRIFDTAYTQLTLIHCELTAQINTTGYDTGTKGKNVSLEECTVLNQFSYHINRICGELVMKKCIVGCQFNVYPYNDNGTYRLHTILVENHFTDMFKITWDLYDHVNQGASIYHIEPILVITDNRFYQSDIYGMYMPYWSQCAHGKEFLTTDITKCGCAYHNNIGNCPREYRHEYSATMHQSNDANYYIEASMTDSMHRLWAFTQYGGLGYIDISASTLYSERYGLCAVLSSVTTIGEVIMNPYREQNLYGVNEPYPSEAAIDSYGDQFDNRIAVVSAAYDPNTRYRLYWEPWNPYWSLSTYLHNK